MQVKELIFKLLDFHPNSVVMVCDDTVTQDENEKLGMAHRGHTYRIENVQEDGASTVLSFTNTTANKLLAYEDKAKAYDRIKEEYSDLMSILCNDLSRELKAFAEAWFRDHLDIDK